MNRWMITDPWVFYGAGGLMVAYMVFIFLRRPRDDQKAGPGDL